VASSNRGLANAAASTKAVTVGQQKEQVTEKNQTKEQGFCLDYFSPVQWLRRCKYEHLSAVAWQTVRNTVDFPYFSLFSLVFWQKN